MISPPHESQSRWTAASSFLLKRVQPGAMTCTRVSPIPAETATMQCRHAYGPDQGWYVTYTRQHVTGYERIDTWNQGVGWLVHPAAQGMGAMWYESKDT